MHSVDSQPLPESCDVLVVGSGAAGLAAAVTAAEHGLEVVVAEKEPFLGGTSAWSGGWLWIPRNPLALAEGMVEDAEQSRTYLRGELHTDSLDARMEAFLEQGPRMVEFFLRHTAVQFFSGSRMPDFHDAPGSVRGGRSLCAQPFDGRQLGPWIDRLRPPLDLISLAGMGIAGGADLAHFFNARRSPRSAIGATLSATNRRKASRNSRCSGSRPKSSVISPLRSSVVRSQRLPARDNVRWEPDCRLRPRPFLENRQHARSARVPGPGARAALKEMLPRNDRTSGSETGDIRPLPH